MIRCRPHWIFSRNFTLEGEGHRASLEFSLWSKSGTIVVDGEARFEVRRSVGRRASWTLNRAGQEVASARGCEIQSPMGSLVLSQRCAAGPAYAVLPGVF